MKLKGLLLAFTQFSFLTAISRVLGLVRDIGCAHYIGAGASFDAFLVAFQVPNFMRKLFGEGAMAQAFVPVLSEAQVDQTVEQQRVLIARVFGALLMAVVSLTILVWLFAPWLVKLYAPGFAADSVRYELAVSLLYWTFPYLIFISLVAFFSAVLNCKGKFAVAAFAPVFLNLSLIAGAVWGGSNDGSVFGLAVAVPVAGCLQLCLLVVYMKKIMGFIWPKWGLSDPGVRKVWRLMLGALFGVSIAQIGLIIDTLLASFLPVGSVSWLYFSQRLVFLPLGLFGVAAATVILPKLSANKNAESKHKTINWAIILVAFLAFPAAAGLIVLAKPIVVSLFNYGAFEMVDAEKTQQSLMALALGLPAFMLNKIFIAVFYAEQNIKTPVKIGAYSLLVNIVSAVCLMQVMFHVGIALAAAIAAWFQLGCLVVSLQKQKLFHFESSMMQKIIVATIFMVLVLSISLHFFSVWHNYLVMDRVLYLFLLLLAGLAAYFGALFVLKWRLPNVSIF